MRQQNDRSFIRNESKKEILTIKKVRRYLPKFKEAIKNLLMKI